MTTTLKNDSFIRASFRQPVSRTPVWVMRQAGRYLPEYRATRAKAGSFMTLCQTPELACEVTLQPVRRFDLDAAIIFSDILTIPDAMGLGLYFVEGEGPRFKEYLKTEKQISQLTAPDQKKLEYVYDAIKLVRHELSNTIPLIGFAGSPWTLACYMTDGHSKQSFPDTMRMCETAPQLLHTLLSLLATSVAAHLNAQIEAGAQAVMIFDTWGGLLQENSFKDFSLKYLKQVVSLLDREHDNQKIPVIVFTKGGGQWLPLLVETGCDVLGLDWHTTLKSARLSVGEQVALQGNLNPAVMLQSPMTIRDAVKGVLASFGHGNGHIFNLGHGITPDVPPEHMSVLVDIVHTESKIYHKDHA